VAIVTALLRFFSFVYHGLLALLLLVFGGLITIAGGADSVRLDMLPWTGSTLMCVLIGGGLFGLTSVILAIKGMLRPLFFLWALLVTIYLIRGYFLSGYRFTPEEFSRVMYLVIGALIALLGALQQMFRSPGRNRN
jgi:hypothetical protein